MNAVREDSVHFEEIYSHEYSMVGSNIDNDISQNKYHLQEMVIQCTKDVNLKSHHYQFLHCQSGKTHHSLFTMISFIDHLLSCMRGPMSEYENLLFSCKLWPMFYGTTLTIIEPCVSVFNSLSLTVQVFLTLSLSHLLIPRTKSWVIALYPSLVQAHYKSKSTFKWGQLIDCLELESFPKSACLYQPSRKLPWAYLSTLQLVQNATSILGLLFSLIVFSTIL